MKLASYAPDGVEHVKKLLSEVLGLGAKVHYVGAPRYFVDITSLDPKTAEKAMQKIEAFIEKSAKGADIEWSLEKEK